MFLEPVLAVVTMNSKCHRKVSVILILPGSYFGIVNKRSKSGVAKSFGQLDHVTRYESVRSRTHIKQLSDRSTALALQPEAPVGPYPLSDLDNNTTVFVRKNIVTMRGTGTQQMFTMSISGRSFYHSNGFTTNVEIVVWVKVYRSIIKR